MRALRGAADPRVVGIQGHLSQNGITGVGLAKNEEHDTWGCTSWKVGGKAL